jgi:hypothetical protein
MAIITYHYRHHHPSAAHRALNIEIDTYMDGVQFFAPVAFD